MNYYLLQQLKSELFLVKGKKVENNNKNKKPPFLLCNEFCTADLVEFGSIEFGF